MTSTHAAPVFSFSCSQQSFRSPCGCCARPCIGPTGRPAHSSIDIHLSLPSFLWSHYGSGQLPRMADSKARSQGKPSLCRVHFIGTDRLGMHPGSEGGRRRIFQPTPSTTPESFRHARHECFGGYAELFGFSLKEEAGNGAALSVNSYQV